MDLDYYKQCAVRIYPATSNGTLPSDAELRSSLERFGTILDIRKFRLKGKKSVNGAPNAAIVIFSLPDGAVRTLQSSRSNASTSLWQKHNVAADSFRKHGPFNEFFARKVYPRLSKKLRENTSDSEDPFEPDEEQSEDSSSEDDEPPAKRSRTENWEGTSYANATMNDYASESSQTSSTRAEAANRMQKQIYELEVLLQNEKAARALAAYQRDALHADLLQADSQKNTAEEALSRQGIELARLRSDLELAVARGEALSNDLNTLRNQRAISEEKLRVSQPPVDESSNLRRKIEALEMELDEARDREEKLKLQNSLQEQQLANPDTTELDQAKAKAKQLESEVKGLELDLLSSGERLKSMQNSLKSKQMSLDLMEQKYSSIRDLYESSKTKLGICKTRLENERATMQKLRDALTPEAYRTFGTTYETLGIFLSITAPPPVDDEGEGRVKQSD